MNVWCWVYSVPGHLLVVYLELRAGCNFVCLVLYFIWLLLCNSLISSSFVYLSTYY